MKNTSHRESGSERNSTRRKLLTQIAGGSAVLPLVGAGTTTANGAPGCRREFDYDSIVDIAEAGADTSGNELIDDVIEEHTADDTLLYFPEGEYRIAEQSFTDLTNFGLCGKDATLLPEDGDGSYWIYGSGLENFQFEGFTLDNTAPNTGPRVEFLADDGLVVRNIHKRGLQDTSQSAFRFMIETEDGEGLIENLRAPDGAQAGSLSPTGINVSGPASNRTHWGHLTFKNCHVEGFIDNGLYASGPDDPASIHVIGGLYRNNNISNVRLGQEGSVVKNARVEVNEAPEYWPEGLVMNMRGIRVATGSGVSIENCDVVMTADVQDDRFTHGGTVHTSGAIVGAEHSGKFSVKNTRIRMDMDGFPAIQAKAPDDFKDTGWFDGSGPTWVQLKNVSITGSATAANHTDSLFENAPTILLTDRDHSTLENVCINQTGADRDGVKCESTDTNIENSVIDVPGTEVISVDSAIEKHNVRSSGTCQSPRDSR